MPFYVQVIIINEEKEQRAKPNLMHQLTPLVATKYTFGTDDDTNQTLF
jgi:hypothetical protein